MIGNRRMRDKFTLSQLCQNYLFQCVRNGKMSRPADAQTLEYIQLTTIRDTESRHHNSTENPRVAREKLRLFF